MSLCKICKEPLVLRLDDDADNDDTETAETVPDDLELGCGCHFHWYVMQLHPFTRLTQRNLTMIQGMPHGRSTLSGAISKMPQL